MAEKKTLLETLIKRIEVFGSISIADYMHECLMNPEHGYYQKQIVFGAQGDFITAPETSQMFGEVLGLKLAEKWVKDNKPNHVNLIELGPGRGTLMADILRATIAITGFHEAITVHFVETSEQLRSLQKEKVPNAVWHDQIHDVPEGYCLIIANEFFDALPIHQFENRDGIWFERMVTAQSNELGYTLSNPGPQFSLVPQNSRNSLHNTIFEVCPAAFSITGIIAGRIKAHGGLAIIIDYGYTQSIGGDTFQALKKHQYVPVFQTPGEADLTAHVAFDQLVKVGQEKDTEVLGPYEQGSFLMQSGIGIRAQQLAENAPPEKQQQILSELKRLTAPDEMGKLFKVLILQNNNRE
jgi:NADH dehydrogenase [ubiquinone] 1 alpha subcomplex assembly factor 7